MELLHCFRVFSVSLVCASLLCLSPLVSAEDYYDLLGVQRQASQRDIRRAFKKLAIKLHPDKNQDDPSAHDKFLKVNRAYEVLKDEELRKKYDMYGEDGLKEDGPSGGQYRSWNYYNQDFGIYDDDPEIITLSKSDFEQSVQNTEDLWFINYYSPHCSHCHDLAPTWRELARELEGVIRIGAVNCEDDWHLCRQQGIQSYPSLLMYPNREKYYGQRDRDSLLRYALKQVRAGVVELWTGNFNDYMKDEEKQDKPWLITMCGDGGDCLEKNTCLKLASMLDGLVNVGMLMCYNNEKLCDKLGVDHGTYYYDAKNVKKGKGMEIVSLDAKEIAFTVLGQLPDVTTLDKASYQKAMSDLKESKDTAWLIHYTESESHDLELRKLPVLLRSMHVGRVDCRVMRHVCNTMHIVKFPTFAVFKPGGSHEFHHGRFTAHDIAAFARDSSNNMVSVLGPMDFPRIVDSGEPWFIDFFAPWCPPCMRLLPEFRKASKSMGTLVNFGTVDCTIHHAVCNKYNVHSYPTTIFYNQSHPHQFQGHHNAPSMVEFLQDTLKPPVIILDQETFDREVGNKSPDEIWLIDFYAPWCGPCQQLAPDWRALAKMVKDLQNIKVAQVDCVAQQSLCHAQQVRSYPTIRLYPTESTNAARYHVYSGWFRDAQSLRGWAFQFLPTKTVTLDWQSFPQKVIEGSDPWIVDFYAPWCGHCQVFAPEFERIAVALDGIANAGKVDCEDNHWLCQQAGIQAYPTVRLYAGENRQHMQDFYGEDIHGFDAENIIRAVKQRVGSKKKKQRKDEL